VPGFDPRQSSFLLVTHNLELARRCDRIIEVVDGRIQPWSPSLPSNGHKFSGDINGLGGPLYAPKTPFLLASLACFRYPMVRLACERPRP
jgi:hypothetical protein